METYWSSGQLLKSKLNLDIQNSDGSYGFHDEGEHFMLVSDQVIDQLDPHRKLALLSQKTAKTSFWTETAVVNCFNIFT